jgi:hypothetical protein
MSYILQSMQRMSKLLNSLRHIAKPSEQKNIEAIEKDKKKD